MDPATFHINRIAARSPGFGAMATDTLGLGPDPAPVPSGVTALSLCERQKVPNQR